MMSNLGSTSSACSRVSSARDLLEQAVRFLDGSASRDPSVQSSPGHIAPAGRGCSSRIGGGDRESSVLRERSLLFNFGRKRSAVTGGESSKKKKKQLALWSHEFVCVSETDQDKTPTPYERALLVAAGMYVIELRARAHISLA